MSYTIVSLPLKPSVLHLVILLSCNRESTEFFKLSIVFSFQNVIELELCSTFLAFRIGWLRLVTGIRGSYTSFHALIAHLFLAPNLDGPQFIIHHLLSDILVAPKCWQLKNEAAVNIQVQVLCGHVFSSFGEIPRSVIAGSCGKSTISSVRNCRGAFRSVCSRLRPHEQSARVPSAPRPFQHLVSVFWILAVLMGVSWYLIAVLIYKSLITQDADCLSTCSLPSVYLLR